MSRSRLIALLLALTTLLVYLPVTRYDFVNFDDQDYVTENPAVQNGLSFAGLKWAFTTGHASNWHPLTWLSLMADREVFGSNAGGYHLVNVLFHVANTVLFFMLVLRFTRFRDGKMTSPSSAENIWPGAFIAALFAWHPLHVESVAWISERKDVLSTFFALLALLGYTRFVQMSKAGNQKAEAAQARFQISDLRPPASGFYWLALVFFALGLMAKPMLVTLPFVMLLLDYWPLCRSANWNFSAGIRLSLEKGPFFLLAAASCVATFLVQSQKSGAAVASLEMVPLHYRLCNSLAAYGHYLLNMLWPVNLAVLYPLSENLARMIVVAAVSAAALLVISWACWRARREYPYLLVGWLWYLGTLVPVIGLVQVGSAALADRYTYIPLMGIFMAMTFGVIDLAKHLCVPKVLVATPAVLVLMACLVLTEKQVHYWRNSETLFAHAVAVTKDNDGAHLNLGVALEVRGDLSGALAHYRAAEQLAPEHYQVHGNLGGLLDQLGQPDAAMIEFREAIVLNPNAAFLHNGAGTTLAELGRFDKALAEFTNAIRLDPAFAAPHARMGDTLLKQGRDAEAVVQFNESVKLEPLNFQTLAHAAKIFATIENPAVRDGKTALVLALKANELSGHNQPMVFDILGMALAENGDFTNAAVCAQNALDLANAVRMTKTEPIQQRLELYKNHQPWRESFLATNAPPVNSK